MAYIIQAEEREIPAELLGELAAAFLAQSPDLTHADATYRVRSAAGMLPMADMAAAARVAQRFNEIGLRCFVVERLLDLPRPEPLNLERPGPAAEADLAVAARLRLVTERTVREFSPRRLVRSMVITGLPLPGSATEERTVEDRDTRYCVDLFTAGRHWHARPGSPVRIRPLLGELKESGAYLSEGARRLLGGDPGVRTFENEADYDHYLTWLYHMRYARA